jgi:hypothetical protein
MFWHALFDIFINYDLGAIDASRRPPAAPNPFMGRKLNFLQDFLWCNNPDPNAGNRNR